MKLIFIIAWRNILRHKGKSLVIGAILFLGAFLMTLGNGVISGMSLGMENNFVNSFLGDIVIISDKQKSDNVFFDFMGTTVEPIGTFKEIESILIEKPYTDKFLPIGKNLAMALSNEEDNPGFAYLIGTDFEKYQQMFPDNSTVLEGRLLKPGEKGVLVPAFARKEFCSYSNTWFIPEGGSLIMANVDKDNLENLDTIKLSSSVVLMGTNDKNFSSDIRFNVKGIIKYNALNTILGHFIICDIDSYRECFGYFPQTEAVMSKQNKDLLNLQTNDIDSMFGENTDMFSSSAKSTSPDPIVSKPDKLNLDSQYGIYNMILLKIKKGSAINTVLKDLNTDLKNGNTGTRAVYWKKAAGPIGSMTTIIKGALFIFVTFLFFVAVIIIINTLTMAALERTSEIGMMRAIGAKKSFIGGMFFGETALLSGFFGSIGIVTGIIVVEIIPLLNIHTDNDFIQILYGGDIFYPVLMGQDISLTVFQLIAVTILASIYPVIVAREIKPIDAIARE